MGAGRYRLAGRGGGHLAYAATHSRGVRA